MLSKYQDKDLYQYRTLEGVHLKVFCAHKKKKTILKILGCSNTALAQVSLRMISRSSVIHTDLGSLRLFFFLQRVQKAWCICLVNITWLCYWSHVLGTTIPLLLETAVWIFNKHKIKVFQSSSRSVRIWIHQNARQTLKYIGYPTPADEGPEQKGWRTSNETPDSDRIRTHAICTQTVLSVQSSAPCTFLNPTSFL